VEIDRERSLAKLDTSHPRVAQVNVEDNAELDWFRGGQASHPVFGRVVQGYDDVVLAISKVKTDRDDRPVEPVRVSAVTIRGASSGA
jgi:cyclophilin family peptidyl-prolyl cis-trans isomerase